MDSALLVSSCLNLIVMELKLYMDINSAVVWICEHERDTDRDHIRLFFFLVYRRQMSGTADRFTVFLPPHFQWSFCIRESVRANQSKSVSDDKQIVSQGRSSTEPQTSKCWPSFFISVSHPRFILITSSFHPFLSAQCFTLLHFCNIQYLPVYKYFMYPQCLGWINLKPSNVFSSMCEIMGMCSHVTSNKSSL